jgi:parallel beta-helix repeat protein
MNCIGNTESAANDHKIINGIYLDARSNKFSIENNIVVNCGGGILLNDKTRDCTVKNNVLYDNSNSALTIVQSNQFNSLDHKITNNTFFNTHNRKSNVSLVNNRGTRIEPGYIDSNTYVSPNEMFHIKRIIVEKSKWKNTREYTLEGWQEEFGQDKNSGFMVPVKDGKSFPKNEIFINESNNPVIIQLNPDFEYVDVHGKQIENEIYLNALEGKILLYRAN